MEQMKQEKIVAIIRGVRTDEILAVADALTAGGVRMMEITFDQTSEAGIRETLASISLLHRERPEQVILGAGTVLTREQVRAARAAGAGYIISPNTNADVIRETKAQGMVSMPGAYTPTEIEAAYTAGADIVKLFPAGLMGAAYIKAVHAPLAHIPVSAVGGVNEHNIREFLDAGACCVGVGGNLADVKAIRAGNYQKLTDTARALTEARDRG